MPSLNEMTGPERSCVVAAGAPKVKRVGSAVRRYSTEPDMFDLPHSIHGRVRSPEAGQMPNARGSSSLRTKNGHSHRSQLAPTALFWESSATDAPDRAPNRCH